MFTLCQLTISRPGVFVTMSQRAVRRWVLWARSSSHGWPVMLYSQRMLYSWSPPRIAGQ